MITVANLNDSGAGSLRAAIAAAAFGEEIVFDIGVVGTMTLTSGELAINQDVIITGPGINFLTITTHGSQRIFNVTSGVVTISNLTMSGGHPVFDGIAGNLKNNGTLTLNNCSVRGGGSVVDGGGIYNLSTITATNCLIQFNGCSGTGSGGRGGGIWNDGTLTLSFCTITNNAVNDGAPMQGGGIWNDGTVTASYCTISSNNAQGIDPMGGGIYSEGTVTLTNCTVDGNTVVGSISTTQNGYGGGLASQFGTLTVDHSTISNNTVTGSGDGVAEGGGIFNAQGNSLNIFSSTTSGNSCSAGTATGGAVYSDNTAAAQISWSTLVENSSGLFLLAGGIAHTYNSIIAGNTGTDMEGDGLTAGLLSDGHNLFGTQSQAFTLGAADQTGLTLVALKIGVLDYNGGPTKTQALLAASPAIDAGDNTTAPTTDQRGGTRIINGTIDIGAYEATASPTVCIPASTYCTTLTNPTSEQIAAAQASLNATALAAAQAEAEASLPLSCCPAPNLPDDAVDSTIANTDPSSPIRGPGFFSKRFTYAGVAGRDVAIWCGSPAFEPYIYLIDPLGTMVAENADNGYMRTTDNNAAQIEYTFLLTGNYEVEVTTFFAGSVGAFNLRVMDGVELSIGGEQGSWTACYVESTKRMFSLQSFEGGSVVPFQYGVVTVYDSFAGLPLNTVSLSLPSPDNLNTMAVRILFYNPNDNSVWACTRPPGAMPGVGGWFFRLDPVDGTVLEKILIATELYFGCFDPTLNKVYATAQTLPLSTTDVVTVYNCGTRAFEPSIALSETISIQNPIVYIPDIDRVVLFVNDDHYQLINPNTSSITLINTALAGIGFYQGGLWYDGGTNIIKVADILTGAVINSLAINYTVVAMEYNPKRNCIMFLVQQTYPGPDHVLFMYVYMPLDLGTPIGDVNAEVIGRFGIWSHMVWNTQTCRMWCWTDRSDASADINISILS